jgi:enterochelin esterase-like enzyme
VKITFPSNEFDEAVSAICHGTVSEEQARALNVLLRESAGARDEYLLRAELHSRLASDPDLLVAAECPRISQARGSVSFSNRDRGRPFRNVNKQQKMIWTIGLAACLVMLAAASWLLRRAQPKGDQKPMVAAAESDWKPSTGNLPGNEYPRINSQRRAQFRIKVPNARHVAVNIGNPLTVTKSDDGVWTVTTAPLAIGFHFYQLVIDGESVPDPATPVFRGGGGDGFSNGIEVPTGEDFHERKNVPQGEVREQRYFAQTTDDWRRIFVYTPPGYHQHANLRFPVLYLLPGAGEDETCWSAQGRVGQILDNLIAEGKAKPMLVAMEGGVARKQGEPDTTWRQPPELSRRYTTLDEVFVNDLIPTIDRTYRTIADAEHRALAGLSLGGAQAFAIGLRNPDKFAHVGAFSGVGGGPGRSFDPRTGYRSVMADAEAFNKRMRVLFISIGEDEPGWVSNTARSYHEYLQAAGIHHVFYESSDTGHEWHTWRRSLREFASLLFKD